MRASSSALATLLFFTCWNTGQKVTPITGPLGHSGYWSLSIPLALLAVYIGTTEEEALILAKPQPASEVSCHYGDQQAVCSLDRHVGLTAPAGYKTT
ncbi:hypothetical protein [Microbulbifer sp. NBRC 101763]|uniref:hypothetical protein n=1 Tax=Microbulbifer sp. NBRC 101763 TaxID=1113820 RepID=UPI00333E993C